MKRFGQRNAIATEFGWDISEVEEYQPTRRMHSRTHLFQAGSVYVVAVREGESVPKAYDTYGPWTPRRPYRGWVVLTSAEAR